MRILNTIILNTTHLCAQGITPKNAIIKAGSATTKKYRQWKSEIEQYRKKGKDAGKEWCRQRQCWTITLMRRNCVDAKWQNYMKNVCWQHSVQVAAAKGMGNVLSVRLPRGGRGRGDGEFTRRQSFVLWKSWSAFPSPSHPIRFHCTAFCKWIRTTFIMDSMLFYGGILPTYTAVPRSHPT